MLQVKIASFSIALPEAECGLFWTAATKYQQKYVIDLVVYVDSLNLLRNSIDTKNKVKLCASIQIT